MPVDDIRVRRIGTGERVTRLAYRKPFPTFKPNAAIDVTFT